MELRTHPKKFWGIVEVIYNSTLDLTTCSKPGENIPAGDRVFSGTPEDNGFGSAIKPKKLSNKDQVLSIGLSIYKDENNLSYRNNRLDISTCDQQAFQDLYAIFMVHYFKGNSRIVISRGPHGLKHDVCIPNVSELEGINHKLKVYFNPKGKRNHYFQIQLASKEMALHLIKNGVVPELEGDVTFEEVVTIKLQEVNV